MGSQEDEVVFDFPPAFRVFKSGRVERFVFTDRVPPSVDPITGVQSKDFLIDPLTGVSVRIYRPKVTDSTQKLPLLIYIHGGAFAVCSHANPMYHGHLLALVAEANVIALSVEYRLAPEHPLPAAYDDAWTAMEWAASHSNRDGPEVWLNEHADFDRTSVVGDSAGANISYNVMSRASEGTGLKGMKIVGLGLVHPFFMIDKPEKLIEFVFPTSAGLEDPRLNPRANLKLGSLRCNRVLIFAAEIDDLNDRARGIHAALTESGFEGSVEIVETPGEDHTFHLFNPDTDNTIALVKKLASFIKFGLD